MKALAAADELDEEAIAALNPSIDFDARQGWLINRAELRIVVEYLASLQARKSA